ncbi:class I SAM-dependent methyltransferase [Candidatus Parcubacteria bacterium]|nr:class I SAM-dependent methyltransferase [Candidatus Parcubacteria bacterium]
MANLFPAQWFRTRRAKILAKLISPYIANERRKIEHNKAKDDVKTVTNSSPVQRYLEKVGKLDIWTKEGETKERQSAFTIVDFGAGFGEIALELAKKFGCLIKCFDFVYASKKVRNSKFWHKIIWHNIDIIQRGSNCQYPERLTKRGIVGKNSADLIIMIYFLQVLNVEEKKEALKEAINSLKAGGKILVIDEVPRQNWNTFDLLVHNVLNYFSACRTYEIFSSDKWKKLFESLELKVEITKEFSRNSIFYMLRVKTRNQYTRRIKSSFFLLKTLIYGIFISIYYIFLTSK